jgi:hypothetical protein
MNVSTLPVVLAVCSALVVISPSTVVLLVLILPPSKLRDNDGTSTAAGGGSNGEDDMVKIPYLTVTLPSTVVVMSPPDGTLALLVVAGCRATVAGGFGSVLFFVVALPGVLCSKQLHFSVPPVATAVLFAVAGLTVAGLSGLVAAAIPPSGLCFILIGGAMVVDVMFGL